MMKHACRLVLALGLALVVCVGCVSPALTATPVSTRTPATVPAVGPSPTVRSSESRRASWPTRGWQTSTPEEQGIDSKQLLAMYTRVRDNKPGIGSIVVVRYGFLVAEGYLYPFEQDDTQHLFSVTKSFISALVGIAIEEGYIPGVDQPVLDLLPGYRAAHLDARKRGMTLYHLLTMTSGFDWRELTSGEDNLAEMTGSRDWVQVVLDRPVTDEPGEVFRYNSGVSHLLSAILQEATGQTALAYAREKLFEPLGISPFPWQSDPRGISIGGWGLSLTARDMAKFGYLYLREGSWDGAQIVPAQWVHESTTSYIATGNEPSSYGYGYQWWVVQDLPYAAYEARGRFGQIITVIPELDLVVVFTSPSESQGAPNRLLREYVLPAVRSPEPLPPNPEAYQELQAMLDAIARP